MGRETSILQDEISDSPYLVIGSGFMQAVWICDEKDFQSAWRLNWDSGGEKLLSDAAAGRRETLGLGSVIERCFVKAVKRQRG